MSEMEMVEEEEEATTSLLLSSYLKPGPGSAVCRSPEYALALSSSSQVSHLSTHSHTHNYSAEAIVAKLSTAFSFPSPLVFFRESLILHVGLR